MITSYICQQIRTGEIPYSMGYCEFLLAQLRAWRRAVPQGGGYTSADHRAMLNMGEEL